FSPALGPGMGWDFLHGPAGSKFPYAAEVGDGLGSSVLVALLCWLMRTFPEAPAIVERRETDQQQWRMAFQHPMAERIRQPNPFYTGRVLWMATVMDFAFGNAYWIKLRNEAGQVVQTWWAPRLFMRPQWDPANPEVFIDHYEYTVNGRTKKYSPNDVVHFRFG